MYMTSLGNSHTLKEHVYAKIKEKLFSGEYVPNQQLQEIELAAQFQVSRSPVREALKQLAGEGLLVAIPNKGTFVRQLSIQNIDDIYDIRLMLEGYGIEHTIENLDADNEAFFVGLKHKLAKAVADCNLPAYVQLDSQLHEAFINLSGNSILQDVSRHTMSLLQPFRVLSLRDPMRFENSIDEHNRLIDAVLDKNVVLACKIDREHLDKARADILRNMNQPE